MKQYILQFLHRGLLACGGGPMVLALIYAIVGASGTADPLSATEAAKAIVTITALAFIAGGITTIYQIERLALFPALVIHGAVLYAAYLAVYLTNGWLAAGKTSLLIFTVCFLIGYAIIWLCIYLITRHKTAKLNRTLHT